MNNSLILKFLADLKENNNKEWFEANRSTYQMLRKECESFIARALKELCQMEPDLGTLTVKDCMFRINRDIRFSNDKTPYKTNVGIVFSPGGKNSNNPIYYLQIEPGNKSFVAGGIYMPPSEQLTKIRQEIDYNAEELKKILNNKEFKKFYAGLDGEKLKKAPKGYPAHHPEIEFLKHKHYIVLKNLTDEEVLKEDFVEFVLKAFKAIKPFNDFLRTAID